jgi:hypothetical protein
LQITEGLVSDPNDGAEAAAIEDAYLESLETLFVNLATSLGKFVLGMTTAGEPGDWH